ncbi:Hypothetical protein A7982_01032 [Minicystis rosea]|nr:Hypothetical protein A7982_01032 [Minicystis rosea]
MNMANDEWKPLDFSGLRARLVEIKSLLEQAAALGAAQDAARLEAMAELQHQNQKQEQTRGDRRR